MIGRHSARDMKQQNNQGMNRICELRSADDSARFVRTCMCTSMEQYVLVGAVRCLAPNTTRTLVQLIFCWNIILCDTFNAPSYPGPIHLNRWRYLNDPLGTQCSSTINNSDNWAPCDNVATGYFPLISGASLCANPSSLTSVLLLIRLYTGIRRQKMCVQG